MAIFDKAHNAAARQRMAEQGYELTPQQLIDERRKAYDTIRTEMRARGYEVPDSDEELFKLIEESQRDRELVERITDEEMDS